MTGRGLFMKLTAGSVSKSLTIHQQVVLSWYNGEMGALRLSLLGSFEALLDARPVKQFRTRGVQALLIYLACHSEKANQRDYLLALLWPGLPQKSAQGNLRHAIYHLRQAIPEVSRRQGPGSTPFLLADRQTVQINPDGRVEVDVKVFDALSGKESTISDLETAADLYRGEFLADFHLPDNANFGEWTLAIRAEYQRRLMAVLGRLAQFHTEANNLDKAEGYARRQISMDDLREEAHRQLMRILFLAGQRSAALTQYERCRRRLMDDLGIEPSAETKSLYENIRNGELDQAALQQPGGDSREGLTVSAQDKGPVQVAHNLPMELTPFIGRERDLSALAALLAEGDTRLVTIVGPGGIGKTRFALATAEHILYEKSSLFPDGIFFVPLRSLESSDLITAAIADALRFRMEYEDNTLLEYLGSKRLLLVMDNYEHLLDGVELISQILQTAPHVQIITTSRERLQLHEEQLYPIHGLDSPEDGSQTLVAESEAGQLFIQTARRINPDFSLMGSDPDHLLRICRLVEGMPLALELAAAWSDTVSLAAIAGEIQDNIDFLATKWQNVPPAHHSIRAVFDGSWGQLNPEEQSLFAQLSIFRGGFSPKAVRAITGITLRDLAMLVQKSLLRFNKVQNLYSVHELLRQYGLQKLEEEPLLEGDLRDRHSRIYIDWLSRQFEPEQMKAVGQKAALDGIQAELENMRAAWIWALRHDGFSRMIPAMENIGRYYQWLGGAREGRRSFQIILDTLAEETRIQGNQRILLKAMALGWFSRFTAITDSRTQAMIPLAECRQILDSLTGSGEESRRQQALYCLQLSYSDWSVPDEVRQQRSSQSLAVYKEIDDPFGCSDALIAMARTARNQGHVAEAQGYIKECLAYQRASSNHLGLAESLNVAGICSLMLNEYEEAEELLLQSLDLAQTFDHHQLLELGFGYLGQEYHDSGRFSGARMMLDQCLKLAAESSTIEFHAGWSNRQGFVYLHLGQYDEAAKCGRRALELVRDYGDSEYKAISMTLLSAIDLAKEFYDAAIQKLEKAAPCSFGVLNTIFGDDGLLVGLAIALLRTGHSDEALGQLRKALHSAITDHRQVNLMYILAGTALFLAKMGEVDQAVELYALASRYPYVGNSHWFEDVVGREITAAGQRLSETQREGAIARGLSLDLWQTATRLLGKLEKSS